MKTTKKNSPAQQQLPNWPRLLRQLIQIERALVAACRQLTPANAAPPSPPARRRVKGLRRKAGRPYGALTAAVQRALAAGPLRKPAIATAVTDQGLQLGARPFVVLDSVLYTPNFRRHGKRFALAKRTPKRPG